MVRFLEKTAQLIDFMNCKVLLAAGGGKKNRRKNYPTSRPPKARKILEDLTLVRFGALLPFLADIFIIKPSERLNRTFSDRIEHGIDRRQNTLDSSLFTLEI
jgi:hypothetical protein